MHISTFLLIFQATLGITSTISSPAATATPGYPSSVPSTVTNSTLSFGTHYAVLNLDLIVALVSGINSTAAGQSFINNTATWINAVHAISPPPLSIFTRIYFSNAYLPEVNPEDPFYAAVSALGNVTADSPSVQLYPAFKTIPQDVMLRKSRYYAGDGNSLEEILRSQKIDTVILSGIRTSGVVLSTVYHLFDLNYNIYVISNNTIEAPSDGPGIAEAILEGIIPKLPANVITIEQAIAALGRSGPAVY